VGDIGDEFTFEPSRGFERFVALAQHQFDAGRVGHIEIGQEHITVRQRHRRDLQHRAVAAVERAARCRMRGDLGNDPSLYRRPVRTIVEKGAHLVDDLADVRLPCDIFLRQSPDLQISRVV
jgi:hypothetical protein